MQVQLAFENKMHVSVSPTQDKLVISMHDIRDKHGDIIVEDHLIEKSIPTQLDEATATTLQVVGSTVSAATNAQFSFNIVLNVLMNSSLGTLISSIKGLQVITHLSLMPMIIPANAQIFFNYIFQVVAFDPIDIQKPVEEYFNLEQSEEVELASNFEQMGYESSYLLVNLGSLLLIFIFEFTVILTIMLLYCAPVKC